MFDRFRDWLLHVLRVPSAPATPPGTSGTVRTFRAARGFYRYRVALWVLRQIGALAAVIFGYLTYRTFAARIDFLDYPIFAVIELLVVAGFILQIPFSFMIMRLDFELRWYMLSDRSLRIRDGILTVREQTMTFANVQNIAIRQNPIERIFGISDVSVRTAGGGSSGSAGGHPAAKAKAGGRSMHEAVFEGVDNATEIRDIIRDRVRSHRDAGLGDPDEPAPDAHTGTGDPVLAAAHQVLEAARSLRAVYAAGNV